MRKVNLWELGEKISIKPKTEFLAKINFLIHSKHGSKLKFYTKLQKLIDVPFGTFRNQLKYSYYNDGLYAPLDVFLSCCDNLKISREELQKNVDSYKTQNGYNIVCRPKLPIHITPLFDMILAHNIADGTVICPKGRRPYFGYRQFDHFIRELYVRKIEAIFGKIKFRDGDYYKKSTRPYCPPVLSQLFFKEYGLNERSFLSRSARIPSQILAKDKDHLIAVLLAFIIDEGNIDSTLIAIKLKNPELTEDLLRICKKLGYGAKVTIKGEYGCLYIKRGGMKKLFKEYKRFISRFPEAYLGERHERIEKGLEIYTRTFYKTKGNREIILKMLESEDLTTNQVAFRMNMTRQGARQHIKQLEKENKLVRKGYVGRKNVLYGVKKC